MAHYFYADVAQIMVERAQYRVSYAGSSPAIGTKIGFRVRKTGIGPAAPLNDVAQCGTFGVSGDSPRHLRHRGGSAGAGNFRLRW